MSFNRCEYCFDPPKTGCAPTCCNCNTCANQHKCHRRLSATIRITRKCTQSCEHCCFSCSPKETSHMSLRVARQVNDFLTANKVEQLNVMGGEVWLNPEWREILQLFNAPNRKIRIVTNGDFCNSQQGREFPGHIAYLNSTHKHPNRLHIAISNDIWHKPLDVAKLRDTLDEFPDLPYVIEGIDGQPTLTESGLVPIGRSVFNAGSRFYMMQTYCSNPTFRYSFLIDEAGDIFKCPFGIWRIGNVSEYQETNSFFPTFKDVYSRHWKAFLFSCHRCVSAHERLQRRMVG